MAAALRCAKLLHLLARGGDKAQARLASGRLDRRAARGPLRRQRREQCAEARLRPGDAALAGLAGQARCAARLLPQVRVPGAEIGAIDPKMAGLLDLSPSTRIHAGTTDGVAAFIATRASVPGDAVSSLGTTLVVKLLAEKPVFAADQGIYSHRLGDRWLAGGASNTGGAALLAHFSADQLEAMTPKLQALRSRPASTIIRCRKPGERFPIADPNLPPRVTPRPDDDVTFFQGLLEGVGRGRGDGLSPPRRARRAGLAPR